jgi:hypothetical protein
MVAAGTTPNITYEKEYPGSFQMDSKKKFFAAHQVAKKTDGSLALEPVGKGVGFLHVLQQRRPLRELLRRQPSFLCRQRRESDGVCARWLSEGCRVVCRSTCHAGFDKTG